jgi:hypothetical protein
MTKYEERELRIQAEIKRVQDNCENSNGNYTCSDLFDCCDCGGHDCGCAYCWSCNACEFCLNDDE